MMKVCRGSVKAGAAMCNHGAPKTACSGRTISELLINHGPCAPLKPSVNVNFSLYLGAEQLVMLQRKAGVLIFGYSL